MTIKVYSDIEQGTEAWDDVRRGMVTASVVGQLLTSTLKVANNDGSRALTALLAAERITGYTEPTWRSDDMWNGVIEEPRARELYTEHHAPVTTAGFIVRDDWGFNIGCSPDGLVGDEGMIEIKTRRQKKHLQTILADRVPAENLVQTQCSLLVSGRDWIDYVSMCSGLAFWTHRVYPDPELHEAIVAAVEQFETNAADMIARYTKATDGLPITERISENSEITV